MASNDLGPAPQMVGAAAEDTIKGDVEVRNRSGEFVVEDAKPVAPDQFEERYETGRYELWSYYSYYIGNNVSWPSGEVCVSSSCSHGQYRACISSISPQLLPRTFLHNMLPQSAAPITRLSSSLAQTGLRTPLSCFAMVSPSPFRSPSFCL